MTQIEKLVAAKKWTKARALILDGLPESPTSHWLWTTLGLTFYEQRRYKKALQCSRRAVALAPDCPLVLWDFAGCLSMCGEEDSALAIWTLLLSMELEEVAYGECAEGMDWAMQLINDVHYRMGKYYQWKKNPELARASFKKYLHNRAHGVGSIYDKQQVEKYLAELTPAESPKSNGASAKRTVKS
jgi:tetratricopeptide (TPR) repeat protein